MEFHLIFIALGCLFLIGMIADEIGRRTRLPRVTLMILFGLAAGPSGLDLLPEAFKDWYEFLASAALTMVAFLLGGKLSVANLQQYGRQILVISAVAVLITGVLVGGTLLAFGTPAILALLLAGISTATAPAATQDVVRQSGADGPFTNTLLGVVAVDDAWGLIAFSMLLLAAKMIAGVDGADALVHGAREIGGALAIGIGIGMPAAFITQRLRPGEPIQAEALGVVFLCAGLAFWLQASFLLAGIVAGAAMANFANHDTRPFREIERLEWPFMVLFFVLAGASLDMVTLREIGIVGIVYLVARTGGRLAGGWLGCTLSGAPDSHRAWMGCALIPQAGVAIGMALVAGTHFPALAQTVLAVTISTTIVFEVFGPILSQIAVVKVGEAGKAPPE